VGISAIETGANAAQPSGPTCPPWEQIRELRLKLHRSHEEPPAASLEDLQWSTVQRSPMRTCHDPTDSVLLSETSLKLPTFNALNAAGFRCIANSGDLAAKELQSLRRPDNIPERLSINAPLSSTAPTADSADSTARIGRSAQHNPASNATLPPLNSAEDLRARSSLLTRKPLAILTEAS